MTKIKRATHKQTTIYGDQKAEMRETLGALNLKIARLQRRLNILTLREVMSRAYPDFHESLQREVSAARRQVTQLVDLHTNLAKQTNYSES